MIIKQSIRAALALALASAVQLSWADYLYFQIQDAEFSAQSGKTGDANFSYATVKTDSSGEEYLKIYNDDGATQFWRLYSAEDPNSAGPVSVGWSDSTSVNYFMVELWGDDDSRVGWQRYGVSTLSEYIWRDGVPTGATALSVRQVIPEPTSGLLLLVGGALLALRRRRGGVC